MSACCSRHVADELPVPGTSGTTLFFSDYRKPVMGLGLVLNAAGIAFMLRMVLAERARHA